MVCICSLPQIVGMPDLTSSKRCIIIERGRELLWMNNNIHTDNINNICVYNNIRHNIIYTNTTEWAQTQYYWQLYTSTLFASNLIGALESRRIASWYSKQNALWRCMMMYALISKLMPNTTKRKDTVLPFEMYCMSEARQGSKYRFFRWLHQLRKIIPSAITVCLEHGPWSRNHE